MSDDLTNKNEEEKQKDIEISEKKEDKNEEEQKDEIIYKETPFRFLCCNSILLIKFCKCSRMGDIFFYS